MIGFALAGPKAAELVAAAQASLPALEEAIKPGGDDLVRHCLTKLAAVFGAPPGRTADHWQVVIGEYFDSLSDMPAEALIEGMKAWRDDPDSRFLPYPGQFKGKCEPVAMKLRRAAYRAKLLAEAGNRAAPPPPDEAELAARRRNLEEMRTMGLKRSPPPPGPPVESPAEMAERLRSQAPPRTGIKSLDDWAERPSDHGDEPESEMLS